MSKNAKAEKQIARYKSIIQGVTAEDIGVALRNVYPSLICFPRAVRKYMPEEHWNFYCKAIGETEKRLFPERQTQSSGHRRFKDIWSTQTDIAKKYGLSSIALGKKLKELGYRNPNGTPTEMAIKGEFVNIVTSNDGIDYYMWHRNKMSDVLSQATSLSRLSSLDYAIQEYRNEMARLDRLSDRDEGQAMMLDKFGPDIVDELVKELSKKLSKEDKIKFKVAIKI